MGEASSLSLRHFTLIPTALLLLCGCANTFEALNDLVAVQAPFDSYVCYDTTLALCSERLDGVAATFIVADPQSGQRLQTSTAPPGGGYPTYTCDYGQVAYRLRLSPDAAHSVVFYSPALLAQVSDLMYRLKRARESCARLVAAFNFQTSLLDPQRSQAKVQVNAQYLSAIIELESLNKAGIGTAKLTADQRAQYGLDDMKISEALKTSRDQGTALAEKLRGLFETQTLSVDYAKQFFDAQSVIDLTLSEINRSLSVLDRSVTDLDLTTISHRNIRSGSWAVQGSTVILQRVRL